MMTKQFETNKTKEKEEAKLFLLTDAMILYIENCQKYTHTQL